MENVKIEEMAEVTTNVLSEDVAENVGAAVKTGFGKKAGIVGGVLLVAGALAYGGAKLVKHVKAAKNVSDDTENEVTEEASENEVE